MNLLGGDLGGTKTLLRLFTSDGETVREKRYDSDAHPSFDEILSAFLADAPPVAGACFAVAGPVIDATAKITNLPWLLNAPDLERGHSLGRVRIVNDFYGIAASLTSLGASDLVVLNPGDRQSEAPRAVIGAGTGLGEAIVARHGGVDVIVPSEGGHCDFAPNDELQSELLQHFRAAHGHVSWERVVSGLGIVDVYDFFRTRSGRPAAGIEEAWEIVRLAEGGDPDARDAFDLFVDCYGAEAGNLALKSLPMGGLFVAGGIAAKNVGRFTDGRFIKAFVNKGRFSDLLAKVPVFLITNPKAGLIGACSLARRLV